ncbi:hypothetical protein CROQUDRAFT_51466, partial [Cronartium quercuum f. sp. fusiforme G11]
PFLPHLSKENIKTTVSKCPPLKGPGSDKIQNWVWQSIWEQVRVHTQFLFKVITISDLIPMGWEMAVTVMIPKPGKPDYTATSVHCPIALLNTLSKIYE